MAAIATLVVVAALVLLALPPILLAGGGTMALVSWRRGRGLPLWLRAARAGVATTFPLLGALHLAVMLGLVALVASLPAPFTFPALAGWLLLLALPVAGAARLWKWGHAAGEARVAARASRRRVDVGAIRRALARRYLRVEERLGALREPRWELASTLATSSAQASRLCAALEDVDAMLESRAGAGSGRWALLVSERARLVSALEEYGRRLSDLEVDALLAGASSGEEVLAFQRLDTEARILGAQVDGSRLARAALA